MCNWKLVCQVEDVADTDVKLADVLAAEDILFKVVILSGRYMMVVVYQVEDVADVDVKLAAVLATEELFLIKVAPVADALVVLVAVAEVAEVVVKFYSTITNK
jgi:hypothetical protein